jgi:hypothetical protein
MALGCLLGLIRWHHKWCPSLFSYPACAQPYASGGAEGQDVGGSTPGGGATTEGRGTEGGGSVLMRLPGGALTGARGAAGQAGAGSATGLAGEVEDEVGAFRPGSFWRNLPPPSLCL